MDPHARVGRRPEIPALFEASPYLGHGFERQRRGSVGHPYGRLPCGGVAEADRGAAVAEKSQCRERQLLGYQVVGALRHLEQGGHLAFGDGRAHLQPRLKVTRSLPPALLGRDLLDLHPEPGQ